MATRSLIFEGNGKNLYTGSTPEQVILEFKEYAFDKKNNKKKKIKGKGITNTAISINLFEYLNSYNVQNHFISQLSENEITVKNLEIIPIEVLIRNYATGNFCKKFNFKEGDKLSSPVLEFYLKDDKLKKPLMSESVIFALNLASKEEVMIIKKLATKINAILKPYFERRDLKLINLRLEFGRFNGSLYVADEISPDTFILWDKTTNEKYNPNSVPKPSLVYKKLYEKIIGEN